MPGLPLRHGTLWEYTKGCRCDECRQSRNDYMREYRRVKRNVKNPRGWQGQTLSVDAERVRQLLALEGRTADEFCQDAGIHLNTLDYLLLRGGATEKTLDLIACGLGCHMSQLERG